MYMYVWMYVCLYTYISTIHTFKKAFVYTNLTTISKDMYYVNQCQMLKLKKIYIYIYKTNK